MTDLALTEDPRAQAEGICGVTQTTGGTEWICVRQVHDPAQSACSETYARDRGLHYFVPRWPRREKS